MTNTFTENYFLGSKLTIPFNRSSKGKGFFRKSLAPISNACFSMLLSALTNIILEFICGGIASSGIRENMNPKGANLLD